MKISFMYKFLVAGLFFLVSYASNAQKNNCIYKDPVFSLDFGTSLNNNDLVMYNIEKYKKTTGSCPEDGFYNLGTTITDCFEGRWHKLPEDHTAGDNNGKMMIVNGAESPGDFFVMTIAGLKPGASYLVSGWFVNICKNATECIPIPPVIEVSMYAGNKLLGSFKTGAITQTESPAWQNHTGEFVMASNTDVLTLQMRVVTTGGCGNDFAMDDIEIIQCSQPVPGPFQPDISEPIKDSFTIPLPKVIESRANPVIKQITTEEAELIIELYDNGEIDGDTVSIYHNNKLVVSRAAITTHPVTLKVKVDKAHPHHELVMVADNLGRIPPNTSLMIITAGKKRYEIFISSSEQKNAKLMIDLQ